MGSFSLSLSSSSYILHVLYYIYYNLLYNKTIKTQRKNKKKTPTYSPNDTRRPTHTPCCVLCGLQPVYTIKHTIVSKKAKKRIKHSPTTSLSSILNCATISLLLPFPNPPLRPSRCRYPLSLSLSGFVLSL